jgi:ABC-2 type transport system ATP-binding protein
MGLGYQMIVMTVSALAIQDLTFSYGEKPVLDGVSFTVATGYCTMLLGPNGAGKTTLFSLIVGLLALQGGAVKRPDGGLAKVGIVFQQSALDVDLTVQQNLHYYGGLHGLSRAEINHRIEPLASRFAMQSKRGEKIRTLNGGHKRRVEIMRALLTNPAVLLLDEPTTGLDIPTRQALVADLHKLGTEQKMAILWATHLVDEVWLDDKLLVLCSGKISAKGAVAEILKATKSKSVADAYLALTVRKAT